MKKVKIFSYNLYENTETCITDNPLYDLLLKDKMEDLVGALGILNKEYKTYGVIYFLKEVNV